MLSPLSRGYIYIKSCIVRYLHADIALLYYLVAWAALQKKQVRPGNLQHLAAPLALIYRAISMQQHSCLKSPLGNAKARLEQAIQYTIIIILLISVHLADHFAEQQSIASGIFLFSISAQ